jgi:hypothetical protein
MIFILPTVLLLIVYVTNIDCLVPTERSGDASPGFIPGAPFEIQRITTKVYQSILNQKIQIVGNGFKSDIIIDFGPNLQLGVDYQMESLTEKSFILTLLPGKKWGAGPGFIFIRAVQMDGKRYSTVIAPESGICIARVYRDPVIPSSNQIIYESQSKLIIPPGSGLTDPQQMRLYLRPTPLNAFSIQAVLLNAIHLQLKPEMKWIPSSQSLDPAADETNKVPLQVTDLDTGAGLITFNEPITIGFVMKDPICDDSCEFPLDGVCDDGSQAEENNNKREKKTTKESNAYYVQYDDYYLTDDEYKVAACVLGSDCTDCSGRGGGGKKPTPPPPPSSSPVVKDPVAVTPSRFPTTSTSPPTTKTIIASSSAPSANTVSSSSSTADSSSSFALPSTFHFLVMMVLWNVVLFGILFWYYFIK